MPAPENSLAQTLRSAFQASIGMTDRAQGALSKYDRQRLIFIVVCLFNIPLIAMFLVLETGLGFELRYRMQIGGLAFCLIGYTLALKGWFHINLSRLLLAYFFGLTLAAVYIEQDPFSLMYFMLVPPITCYLFGHKEGLVWSLVVFLLATPGAIEYGLRYFAVSYVSLAALSFLLENLRAAAEDKYDEERKQKNAEHELLLAAQADQRASESRFKTFSELASDWLFELDENLTYTFATPRVFEIMAASPNLSLSELRTDMRERHILDAMKRGEEISNAPVSFENYRGELIYVLFSAKPLFDTQGKFSGYIGAGTDITEIKLAEEGLRLKDQTLHHMQKLEALGQLTSGVAHDFNNLLAIIGGNIELLQDRAPGDEERQKLEASLRAVNRAADLTQQLLSFARKQELDPKDVQVEEVFDRLTSMFERTVESSIKIEADLEQDLWPCYADEGQLESAILNLVLNARDAMEGRGQIALAARNLSVTDAEGDSLVPGDYVAISVTDDGSGIAGADLSRIMEPFFTTKPVGEGTGLGLSMVYGFARQSGGRLEASSELGVGSVFSILLPRGQNVMINGQVTESDESLLAGDVVVIDDDADVLNVLIKGLEKMGLQVHAYTDAECALSELSELDPQLLVSDLMLGEGMNGVELVDRVSLTYPELPILLISGNPDQLLNGSEIERYRSNLLSKPFSYKRLRDEVKTRLQAAGA